MPTGPQAKLSSAALASLQRIFSRRRAINSSAIRSALLSVFGVALPASSSHAAHSVSFKCLGGSPRTRSSTTSVRLRLVSYLLRAFCLRACSRSPWRAHCGVKIELRMLTYYVYAPLLRSILPCTASLQGNLEQALTPNGSHSTRRSTAVSRITRYHRCYYGTRRVRVFATARRAGNAGAICFSNFSAVAR